jgi:hypothetical protein
MSKAVIAIHAALAGALLAWSGWGAYTFWAGVFGHPLAALGALAVAEAVALAGFALHVLGAASPLTVARHALPVVSVLPVAKSLHDLAVAQVGNGWAWTAAAVIGALLTVVAWMVWTGLERILCDPLALRMAAQQRQADALMQQMRATLLLAARIKHLAAELDAPPPAALTVAREEALPQPTEVVSCARCGAPIPLAGRAPHAVRAASGRYGCAACAGLTLDTQRG